MQSSTRGYEPKDLCAYSESFHYIYCPGFKRIIKGIVESPFIIVIRVLSYPESNVAVHTGHSTTPVTPLMSDRADSSIPLNSFRTIEQAIKQAYFTFQADLLPVRLSSAQA